MRAISLACFAAVALGGCTSPRSPLDGTWSTLPIPSGASLTLVLTTSGSEVAGTGQQIGIGPQSTVHAVVVTGVQALGTFTLTLKFDSGGVATYAGERVGDNELDGVWTVGSQSSGDFRFLRE